MSSPVDTFVAPPCSASIDILHVDEDFLLINKPSGLLSLSGKNPLNRDSVHFRLLQDYPSATLVHRLDFGTSGLMLVALNKLANVNLSQQFQQRSVAKTYIAIVNGHLLADQGWVEAPISKDKRHFPRLSVCFDTGQSARSHYKVLERVEDPPRTRVLFAPVTGRTHQLRIHSQFIGHSILGCDLYGSVQTQAMSERLLLHAATLSFAHPQSGKVYEALSPCPF
jgi:tRNA pseudouridine32 synthase/23S rRNA pseudouridine746 synthase